MTSNTRLKKEDVHREPQKKLSLSTVLPICCLVGVLVIGTSPFIAMFWQMSKGVDDMKRTREAFVRTVNPDELRAWVFSQIKRHPKSWDAAVPENAWSGTFPQLPGKPAKLYFYDGHRGPNDTLLAKLVWAFSSGYSMKVTVLLNADGTPPDFEDERDWARGITIDMLAK